MLILELLHLHELLADFAVLGEDHRVNLDFSLLLFACILCQYVDYLGILLVVGRLELEHLLTHSLHFVVVELFQVRQLAANLRDGVLEAGYSVAVVCSESFDLLCLGFQLILLLLVGGLKLLILQLQIVVTDG